MKKLTVAQIDQIETELTKGNYALARDILNRVVRKDSVPETLLLRISQLARRVDYPTKGLMLLRDRVLDPRPRQRPDAGEVLEYAACLLKVGGFSECIRMLNQPEVKHLPEATKTLAFAHIHQWEYETAVPLLKDYLNQIDPTSYSHLVGSMNLASALVELNCFEEACELLATIVRRATRDGRSLLLGNANELLAQISILTHRWQDAEMELAAADRLLTSAQPRYRLYIDKWRAIAALTRDPSNTLALNNLKSVRCQAQNSGSWETVRECDFYESLLLNRQDKFSHLYFGTPYPSYRKKIGTRAAGRFEIPKTYRLQSSDELNVLRVAHGDLTNGQVIFKKQQKLHRTIWALTRDFYAPISLPQLFSELFSNEYFHYASSPHRLRELIRRIKSQLQRGGMPVQIDFVDGGLKINLSNSKLSFEIALDEGPRSGLLGEIISIYGQGDFSLRDLAQATSRPHTTVYRELKELVSNGAVKVKGSGKTSTYSLSHSMNSIKAAA